MYFVLWHEHTATIWSTVEVILTYLPIFCASSSLSPCKCCSISSGYSFSSVWSWFWSWLFVFAWSHCLCLLHWSLCTKVFWFQERFLPFKPALSQVLVKCVTSCWFWAVLFLQHTTSSAASCLWVSSFFSTSPHQVTSLCVCQFKACVGKMENPMLIFESIQPVNMLSPKPLPSNHKLALLDNCWISQTESESSWVLGRRVYWCIILIT